MYCSKCGTKNDDDARFCVECRNPLGSTSTSSSSSATSSNSWFYSVADSLERGSELKKGTVPPTSKKSSTSYVPPVPPKKHSATPLKGINISNNNLFKIIGVIAIIVVIAVGVMISGVLKPGCEKRLENLMKATLVDYDAEAIVDIFPECYLDSQGGRSSMVNDLSEKMEQFKEQIENYNMKFSYEILGSEDVSSSELQDIKEQYSNTYDVKVKKVKKVKLKLNVSVMGKTETDTEEIPMVKIGGSWYADVINDSSSATSFIK